MFSLPQLQNRRPNRVTAHYDGENSEHQLQRWAFELVCVFAADPRAQRQQSANDERGFEVHVVFFVVFPHRARAKGQKQDRQAGSGRFVLRKSEDVNQRRHDNQAAADAEKTRRDARNESGEKKSWPVHD